MLQSTSTDDLRMISQHYSVSLGVYTSEMQREDGSKKFVLVSLKLKATQNFQAS